jgi:solute carrier family 13 (sodium-dependent dicarboxylate transporter), member 2/3/5
MATQNTRRFGSTLQGYTTPWLRPLLICVGALVLAISIWFGLPSLDAYARIAFITFGLAVLGWIFTSINDTYIAIAAALVFTLTGIDQPDEFFETLGDSTIWLLLASFIVAAAVKASGLSRRLAITVAARARSVNQLFYVLTGVLIVTAFVIPATSGRAALMLPIFVAITAGIGDRRITRALALLFPTIILLSAVASLIGAGAHLVTAEILERMGGENINFAEWLMLGGPFALVSCFASAAVILHVFLNRDERRRRLQLTADQLAGDDGQPATPRGGLSRTEKYVIAVVGVLVLLWTTEPLHGLDNTIVALLGALAVTAPRWGVIGFKDGIKSVEWNMLLFMAATLELGEALVESGGAEWLVQRFFSAFQNSLASSALVVTGVVALVSLLAHLLITSRTARSSVLVPIVVLLALSLGYNPTTMAFLSTAAAGFCLTLPVSAKPVAMFSQLSEPTYAPRDLLRLSGFLLPLHFVLLLAFAFWVWPLMGLTLARQAPQEPPSAPGWNETRERRGEQPARPTAEPWAIFSADDEDNENDEDNDDRRAPGPTPFNDDENDTGDSDNDGGGAPAPDSDDDSADDADDGVTVPDSDDDGRAIPDDGATVPEGDTDDDGADAPVPDADGDATDDTDDVESNNVAPAPPANVPAPVPVDADDADDVEDGGDEVESDDE